MGVPQGGGGMALLSGSMATVSGTRYISCIIDGDLGNGGAAVDVSMQRGVARELTKPGAEGAGRGVVDLHAVLEDDVRVAPPHRGRGAQRRAMWAKGVRKRPYRDGGAASEQPP